MKSKSFRIITLTLTVVVISNLLVYFFQPFKFGFTELSIVDQAGQQVAHVFIDTELSEEIPWNDMSEWFQKVEAIHGLDFQRRMKLYICRNHRKSRWLVPWFRNKVSAFAMGNRVVVVQWEHMNRLDYSLEDVLIHELSHLLMQQNSQSWINRIRFVSKEHGWVREGLAVWAQNFYTLSMEEILEPIEQNDWETFMEGNQNTPGNHRYFYNFYGYFFQFLDENHGREKLQQWIKAYLMDPAGKETSLQQIYGKDLDELLKEFYLGGNHG